MSLFKSLYLSFKRAFIENENILSLEKKYPHTYNFLQSRFDKTKLFGLPLTIFGILFISVLMLLLESVANYIFSDIVARIDVLTNILLIAFRKAATIKIFIWITLLGEIPTIVVFTLIVSTILWIAQKKWHIITLWLTIIGSEGLTFTTKLLIQRPRPLNAVFLEDSNSFPSGHATIAVAFYGFIAYLIFKKVTNKLLRSLLFFITLLIILGIGFSRLYLGVHFVSDVWAGYLVGLLWLIIGTGLTELKLPEKNITTGEKKLTLKSRNIISSGLVLAGFIFYLSYGFAYHPKFLSPPPLTVAATAPDITNIFNNFNLPRYTETLTGAEMKPINFIISAKDDLSLIHSFKKAGWSSADLVSFTSVFQLIKNSILNKPYEAAPMTPSFWNKTVHNFGFEKSTETESARQRHHARFWKTNLITEQGGNIYVGTVSLDIGIKWFITHKISPDIDTERELLFSDLQKAAEFENYNKIKLVSPILGKNFIGDQFFTDGVAYFINLNR